MIKTRLVTDLYSPSGGRGLPRDPLAGLCLAVLATRPLSVGTFSNKWHNAVFSLLEWIYHYYPHQKNIQLHSPFGRIKIKYKHSQTRTHKTKNTEHKHARKVQINVDKQHMHSLHVQR